MFKLSLLLSIENKKKKINFFRTFPIKKDDNILKGVFSHTLHTWILKKSIINGHFPTTTKLLDSFNCFVLDLPPLKTDLHNVIGTSEGDMV